MKDGPFLPLSQYDQLAMLLVGVKTGFAIPAEFSFVNHGRNFEIDEETTDVHIRRSYERQSAVDADRFGVDESFFVQIDAHTPL